MTVYFSAGEASNVERDDKLSDLTNPSWQIEVHSPVNAAELRSAVSSLLESRPHFGAWDPNEENMFQFGDATGCIMSSRLWFSSYLDRSSVLMLLAAIAGGESVAPNAAGDGFETVDKATIRRRLRAFITHLETFISSSDELPAKDGVALSSTDRQSDECYLSLLDLSRDCAAELSDGLRTRGLHSSPVDPREYYFLAGDEGTARMVLAVLASEDIPFAGWHDDEGDWDATRARLLLQQSLADELAVFLEVGYPSQIEVSDPQTTIQS